MPNDVQQALPWALWALEVLLFVTAMLVNGTGSLSSVVTQLDTLSFAAKMAQFGLLPATSQAALIMAGLSAFIIPIGTLVAGEGLAAIVLEPRIGADYRELRWRDLTVNVMCLRYQTLKRASTLFISWRRDCQRAFSKGSDTSRYILR